MTSPFTMIGNSWSFFKKQPVLNPIIFWLVILPTALMIFLETMRSESPYFQQIEKNGIDWGTTDIRLYMLSGAADLVLTIVLTWGLACILLVGKRILTKSAGRTRTSFKIVRTQAANHIADLFLTNILRDVLTLLWSLVCIVPALLFMVGLDEGVIPLPPLYLPTPTAVSPLISAYLLLFIPLLIPAARYLLQTVFFPVTMVCEGKRFRASLRASRAATKGKLLKTLGYELTFALCILFPTLFISGFIEGIVTGIDVRLILAAELVGSVFIGLGIVVFTLANIALYAEIKKLPTPTK